MASRRWSGFPALSRRPPDSHAGTALRRRPSPGAIESPLSPARRRALAAGRISDRGTQQTCRPARRVRRGRSRRRAIPPRCSCSPTSRRRRATIKRQLARSTLACAQPSAPDALLRKGLIEIAILERDRVTDRSGGRRAAMVRRANEARRQCHDPLPYTWGSSAKAAAAGAGGRGAWARVRAGAAGPDVAPASRAS